MKTAKANVASVLMPCSAPPKMPWAQLPTLPVSDLLAESMRPGSMSSLCRLSLIQSTADSTCVLDGGPLLDDTDGHEGQQGEPADDDEHSHDERAPGAPDVVTLEPVDHGQERRAEQDGEQGGHHERGQHLERVGQPDKDDDDPDRVPADDADAPEPAWDEAVHGGP